jgi:hypothetical protein
MEKHEFDGFGKIKQITAFSPPFQTAEKFSGGRNLTGILIF